MAKSSATALSTVASPAIQINDMAEQPLNRTISYLSEASGFGRIPDDCSGKDFHSDVIRGHLQTLHIERGRVTCVLSVKPALCNGYGSLHGGFVAAAAEFVSTACARTVVAEDRDVFLGEQSISYLSGVPVDAHVVIEASVIRSGRNLTVASVEFRHENTRKLVYTARSTFYNTPIAKL